MANTYVAIATVTVGSGGAANIEFTNIPASYTDLKLVVSARGSYTGGAFEYITLSFNNSSSNFSFRNLYYYFASTSGSSSGTTGWPGAINGSGSGATASTFSNAELYIPNYTSSNNKSYSMDIVTEQNGTTGNEMNLNAVLWSNTAAISSIKLTAQNGNFVQYSTAYLYGIRSS